MSETPNDPHTHPSGHPDAGRAGDQPGSMDAGRAAGQSGPQAGAPNADQAGWRDAGQAGARDAGQAGAQDAGQPGPQAAGQPGPQAAGQPGPQAAGQPGPQAAGQPGPQAAGQPGPQAAGQPGPQAAGRPGAAAQDPGQTWGAPPTGTAPRWTWRKTLIAAAVAVGIAGAGGAAVWAASTAAGDHTGRGGGGMVRIAGGPMGGGHHLHGESVVKDEDGDYTTQLTQTGEVTALTADSLTARSEDGYTKTYTLTDDTVLESVDLGDEVMVVATLDGTTATAESVFDTAEMGKGMNGPGHRIGPGGPGDQAPADRGPNGP